ncbi:hypothetical protein EMMF5_001798 [Cystobasidiomycetes sp. EMM_F5]
MGNSEFGYCPSSHPKRFISLFYEAVFNVQKFPYRSGAWVYSFGDNTGNGFHADFISGWDVDLLSQAIVQCNLPNGGTIDECAPLKAASDQAKANACKPSRPVLNEDYGLVNPIKALPGDNPVWSGTGPKPSCQCFLPYPAYISPNSTLSPGYSTVGCIGEGTSGRALTGASFVSTTNMTGGVCTTFCAGKGFKYAATEYAQECYCGNSFVNGATGQLIDPSQCGITCKGNGEEAVITGALLGCFFDSCLFSAMENCGGSRTLTLYKNSNNVIFRPNARSNRARLV